MKENKIACDSVASTVKWKSEHHGMEQYECIAIGFKLNIVDIIT